MKAKKRRVTTKGKRAYARMSKVSLAAMTGRTTHKTHKWICVNEQCADRYLPLHSPAGGGGRLACDRCGKMMKKTCC